MISATVLITLSHLYLNEDPLRNKPSLFGAGRRSVLVDLSEGKQAYHIVSKGNWEAMRNWEVMKKGEEERESGRQYWYTIPEEAMMADTRFPQFFAGGARWSVEHNHLIIISSLWRRKKRTVHATDREWFLSKKFANNIIMQKRAPHII